MNAQIELRVLGFTLATIHLNVDLTPFQEPGVVVRPVTRGVKKISSWWVKGMTA